MSDRVLESISEEARRCVREKQCAATEVWDDVVGRGLARLLAWLEFHSADAKQFTEGLSEALVDTLVPIAARIGVMNTENSVSGPSQDFGLEFVRRAFNLTLSDDPAANRILLFRECCEAITLFAQRFPAYARHAELLSLMIFNYWHGAGILAKIEDAIRSEQQSS